MDTIVAIAPAIVMLVMLAALAKVLWSGIRSMIHPPPGPVMVCAQCGSQGPAERHTRGSTLMELVLWCLFIVPGLIYSVWRLSSRTWRCQVCGGTQLIPPNSPMARSIAQRGVRQ